MSERFGFVLVRPRTPQNPFDPEPQTGQKLYKQFYCTKCKEDTDTEVERGDAEGVYVYRRRCRRCGGVIEYGMDRRALTGEKPISRAAMRWIRETGKDRR